MNFLRICGCKWKRLIREAGMEKSGNGFGKYEAEKRKSGVDERKSGGVGFCLLKFFWK